MTPTNRTDEVAREVAKKVMRSWRSDYEVVPLLKRLEERFANAFASAITSAVEAERERVDKIILGFTVCKFDPRMSPMPDDKMRLVHEIAKAVRQTPTQEGV